MAEPLEPKSPAPPVTPKRPVPPGVPGGYLPRLWKADPEEDPEIEAESKAKKKKKKGDSEADAATAKSKKRKPAANKPKKTTADGEKGVLVEETPNFDTIETRQRIRIGIGVVFAAVILVVGWRFWVFMAPERVPEDPPEPDIVAAGPTGDPHARDEQESRILFDRARDIAKNGKAEVAASMLKTIIARYPATLTGKDAREALERPKQNLPLFLDRPAITASPGDKPPPTLPAPPTTNVVEATKTAVSGTSGAQANLVPPANPVELMPPNPPQPQPSPGQEKAARALPTGFRPRTGAEFHSTGWPLEIVGDRDGAPMVFVAGGTFIQGRDDADPSEAPAHQVTLGGYYIDKHEVTVRQFNLFQKEAGKRSERTRYLARDPALQAVDALDDFPVVQVTAREASDFCYWANKHLPSEAQWEAAARSPDGRLFPWGPDPSKTFKPHDVKKIVPVMSIAEDLSPYGAFDLAGNAAEWTKDWYDPRYYALYRTAPADHPIGPLSRPRSSQLVVKGMAKDWAVSKRDGLKPQTRLPNLGFRGVIQVEGPGNAFEPPPTAAPANAPPGAPSAGGGATVPF